jgi:hypothetical protein
VSPLRTVIGRSAAAAAVALLLLLFPAVAQAAQAPPASAGPAYVRLAHLSPDTPNVDVYLASVSDPALRFVVDGVGYGAVSDYRVLPRGAYTVSMRAAGAPADSPPVLATTLDAVPGAAYTVAGVGHYRDLGLTVLDDDLTMPAPGTSRVRVINAAATAPRVDVTADGAGEVAAGVPFAAASAYRTVPEGNWNLQVSPQGGAPTRLPIRVGPNSVYTVLLLDDGPALRAQLLDDGNGSAGVPRGGVETGMGGTSGPVLTVWTAVALLSAAAVASLAVVAGRRRVR